LQQITIEGVPTTIPVLIKVLQSEPFQNGSYNTGTLSQLLR
jgi:biotin carboxylase